MCLSGSCWDRAGEVSRGGKKRTPNWLEERDWGKRRSVTYEEYRFRPLFGGLCVLFAQRDQFFGQTLRFFGFGEGRGYGFIGDEGCD
jgi:hypothetical protein